MPLSKIDSDSLNTGAVTSAAMGTASVASAALASGVPTRAQLPAGSVLQVVNFSLVSSASTSSSSDQATGLVASITPTFTTSKILIFVTPYMRATQGSSTGNCFAYLKLWRGAITSGTLLVNGYPIVGAQNADFRGVGAMNYYDSPATTSSTTYTVSMNSSFAASVGINETTNPSSITLMEIAA